MGKNKKKYDLQGNQMANGKQKVLVDNPGYGNRYTRAIEIWNEEGNGDGKAN